MPEPDPELVLHEYWYGTWQHYGSRQAIAVIPEGNRDL